jgi:cAMP-dependent protein kinase regulator
MEESRKLQLMKSQSRRAGVSAQPISADRMSHWKRPVYPKSPNSVSRLVSIVTNSDHANMHFLFGHLSKQQLDDLIMAMSRKDVKKGDVVIRQGDEGDAFYIVDEGTFDIYVLRNKTDSMNGNALGEKVATVGSGSSFGELALMYNSPRAATVVCTSEHGGRLWALDRDSFQVG